ncbi:MAG: hypothetical protein ACRYHQ_19395 [Janthinobacterium lividum]
MKPLALSQPASIQANASQAAGAQDPGQFPALLIAQPGLSPAPPSSAATLAAASG